MGKRKRKDSDEYIQAKIRKLEKRLRRRHRESSSSSEQSITAEADLDSISPRRDSIEESPYIQSVVVNPSTQSIQIDPLPSTSKECPATEISCDQGSQSIPIDILDMLGDPKKKQEIFGPKIQDDVSKRWGRILCEGLKREQKKEITERILIPENFQLVKAPKLNPEIAAVSIESTRNRDKRLEVAQNYLGLGISAQTSIISSLIEKDLDKFDLIKHLSEVNQIMLDLHFENTQNRRKLITYSLDKKFLDMVQDVERDSLLFGENLTEKIKASKSAEKSGLQIKKTNPPEVLTSRKPGQQGNWKGPPRQIQRGTRRGGAKSRPSYRSSRPAPDADRRQGTSKTRSRPRSKTR